MASNNHCYSSSPVNIFLSFDNFLYCYNCQAKPEDVGHVKYNYVAYNTGVMLHHLERHKTFGHLIPEDLKSKLITDDYINFPEGGKQGGCFVELIEEEIELEELSS